MRHLLLVLFILATGSGCAGLTETVNPDLSDPIPTEGFNDNHWVWGYWQMHIPADRSTVDKIPVRFGNYHFCVTKFMETSPCGDCLSVSNPDVQPDGTIKYDVTLRHPFPNLPKYTGFDVRGMVYFPPTQEHPSKLSYSCLFPDADDPLLPMPVSDLPLIFSRRSDGGGELLNADGYSCYLIPGLFYSHNWPIFNYSIPNNGIEPTPVTTITPYKLFCSDTERRMFLIDDEITKEYHIALPDGPFTFGYAVDASWWPPHNLPVTDPPNDFPREANAEDPWLIEFEQLLPICEENIDKDIFKITIHHRGINPNWHAGIYSWDMNSQEPDQAQFYASSSVSPDEFTTELYDQLSFKWWYFFGDETAPGEYPALLIADHSTDSDTPNPSMMRVIISATFVTVVVE